MLQKVADFGAAIFVASATACVGKGFASGASSRDNASGTLLYSDGRCPTDHFQALVAVRRAN